MTPKQLVKLSNIIGITAIILLVYWVFTFITIEVFGLKVFRENMTETFYLSVLWIENEIEMQLKQQELNKIKTKKMPKNQQVKRHI